MPVRRESEMEELCAPCVASQSLLPLESAPLLPVDGSSKMPRTREMEGKSGSMDRRLNKAITISELRRHTTNLLSVLYLAVCAIDRNCLDLRAGPAAGFQN
ncbi:hypothetical protein BaRGS_00029692 [Batillaria attramentaria]|uniref:Uncharacterized protein n=1 Tax=Batillaria attramentaria TaxID=370345 RepID=A0ABD0JWU4_9CAEN